MLMFRSKLEIKQTCAIFLLMQVSGYFYKLNCTPPLDQSTTFTVSLQNSDGQAVILTQIGKLDTVILFQASGLEQKEYQLKVTVANPTICRITVAQENDFLVDIRFTPNPSEDAPKDTVMFGELRQHSFQKMH